MLLLDTLRKKPEVQVNGEYIKDMTAPSVEFGPNMLVAKTGIVSGDLSMRADLVARIYFDNANKLDAILKFNGISNPFSLNEGDIVLVPSKEDMKTAFKQKTSKDNKAAKDELVKKFFDPDKMSKKDKKRIEYLRAKSDARSNGSKTNLPPNFAEPNSKEMRVVDGAVVFGGDVVPSKENCTDPLSKARAKSKLIENKIFRSTR